VPFDQSCLSKQRIFAGAGNIILFKYFCRRNVFDGVRYRRSLASESVQSESLACNNKKSMIKISRKKNRFFSLV